MYVCSFSLQEQKKSSKLEESMKMLDYEMKKTDDLLYRMIPKPVAKRLRKGEPAVNTCEVREPPGTENKIFRE